MYVKYGKSHLELNERERELNKFHNYENQKITCKASDTLNISSCLVLLPPEIVMYDALMLFSECPPIYASSCMTISGGRTEQLYNCRFSAVSLALQVIFVHQKRRTIYASCMTISGERNEQHVVMGFGELAAVD